MNRCMLQHHLQQAKNARTLEVMLVSSTSPHAAKQVRQNRSSTGEHCCLLEYRWLLQHSCNLLAPQMLLWCLKSGKRHVILLKQGCRHCRPGDTAVTLLYRWTSQSILEWLCSTELSLGMMPTMVCPAASAFSCCAAQSKQAACIVKILMIHARL